MAFDFPSSPTLYQVYTHSGVTWVWNGYAWVTSGPSGAMPTTEFVLKVGDTMTGPLVLPGDPTTALQAAPKQYVDAKSLPAGGTPGQALVINASNVPIWGSPIEGGSF